MLALPMLLWCGPAGAQRLDPWRSEVALASARFGIPELWIRAVMRAESNGEALVHGRPIVSRAGAMGLMQLMPGTWRDMRLGLGLGSDPQDPHDNILAGAAYLKLMYDRFGYPGLFGAYNAGPARYALYLAGGRPLPSETRAYMKSIVQPGSGNPATLPALSAALFAFRSGATPATPVRPPGPQPAELFVALGERR